jgi:hypothetical protein
MVQADVFSGTLTMATQQSIISVGQLSNLSVSGSVSSNIISSASAKISNLTGLNDLSVTETIQANNFSGTLLTAAQPNITSVGQLN